MITSVEMLMEVLLAIIIPVCVASGMFALAQEERELQ